ncbi:hypothetical protein ACLOJK_018565 [Asimina triloba]
MDIERWALSSPSREEDEGEEATRGEWVPLQKHPLFSSSSSSCQSDVRLPSNLIAWDGSSRLYLWDSSNFCLRRLTLRFSDPDPDSIYASSSSKVRFLPSSYSIALLGFHHFLRLGCKLPLAQSVPPESVIAHGKSTLSNGF